MVVRHGSNFERNWIEPLRQKMPFAQNSRWPRPTFRSSSSCYFYAVDGRKSRKWSTNHRLQPPCRNWLKICKDRTHFQVKLNLVLSFKPCVAQETWKLSAVRVNWLMKFQLICCNETLLTFIANIRLHTFMSLYVLLKVTVTAELLLTNVTCEPMPSLCDFNRCLLNWFRHTNSSEQCLHENDFAPVWTGTWRFISVTVANCFPQ